MTDLQALLDDPSPENWEAICAHLDAIPEGPLLQEKVAHCLTSLENWPDDLRYCPEAWESQADTLKYQQLPRTFRFPYETGLIATFIREDNFVDIPNQDCACLVLHYNDTLKLVAALFTEKTSRAFFVLIA